MLFLPFDAIDNEGERSSIKVTVLFERCFQLSASNTVNTHRIPANLYINRKLIKFSK